MNTKKKTANTNRNIHPSIHTHIQTIIRRRNETAMYKTDHNTFTVFRF